MSEQAAEFERVDWTEAEVHNQFADGAVLVVRGETPAPMDVELHPLPIGIAPQDYQGVELRGHRAGIGPQVITPFQITKDVKDLPHGLIGFVLVGATMRLYVPPKEGE